MRIAFILLLIGLTAFADETKTSFGGSPSGAGIVSYGNARASDFSGVKTKLCALPVGGFGNTIQPDGSITTDTNLDWTYTKKVITETWTTNWTPIYGRDVPAKQAYLLGYWGLDAADPSCAPTLWNGYIDTPLIGQYTATNIFCGGSYVDISKCVYDVSSETNYVALSVAGTGSGFYTNIQQVFNVWVTNGNTVYASNINQTIGSTIPSGAFTGATGVNSTNYDEWNDITTVDYKIAVTNISGGVWTYSQTSRLDVFYDAVYYPLLQVCAAGSEANMTYNSKNLTYTRRIEYSEAKSRTQIASATTTPMDVINLHVKGERYVCFDRTNYPVLLTWNPIYWPEGLRFNLNIMRGESPTAYDYTVVNTLVNKPYTSLYTNWPFYIDTTAISGKQYYYRIEIRQVAPAVAFEMYWYGTNSVSTVKPEYAILPPLEIRQRTIQATNTLTNTALALNFQATNMWHQLLFDDSYTSFTNKALVGNANSSIALYPLTGTNFVLSTNLNLGKSYFLAAAGIPTSLGGVSFGSISNISGASAYYSAASLGYLPRDNPSNSIATSNWLAKIYFTNYDRTANQTMTNYLLGFGRWQVWTNNRPWLLSNWKDYKPTDLPTNGFMIYR